MKNIRIVLAVLIALPLALAQRQASQPASRPAAEWTQLYADQPFYKDNKEPEQVFTGTLELTKKEQMSTLMRSSRYNLGGRTLFPAAKQPALEKFVGQKVEIKGKVYDTTLEGQQVREIWPAAIRPMGTTSGPVASGPATTSAPAQRR